MTRGLACTFLEGAHDADRPWHEVWQHFAGILDDLRSAQVPAAGLPPARTWCGGEAWPDVVERITADHRFRMRSTARAVVREVLNLHRAVNPALVHGDFGPHNILWDESGTPGLIDFDNACAADPAIDVAPLIGFYGAEHGPATGNLIRQQSEPAQQGCVLSATANFRHRPFDKVRGALEIRGTERVPDRVLRQIIPLVPVAGEAVKGPHMIRASARRPRSENIGEESVIPVPPPLVIQWHDEQVVALQDLKKFAAIRPARHGFAERTTETVQERGAEQEITEVVRLTPQHLFAQIIDHEAVAAGECLDETGDV
ncbi:aminoglycoside phosphotransferase family protein [Arthrobacter sp. H5]|uniref:aminoglycoside phosphotransferase family protein n=1 Tax=Arthrobacter sp. H5 TaxID=1267973 RepID=UPI0012DE6291|nr:aminoglycoside phosphotransferase family protein [Arthrobacter sp. H5]